MTKGKKSNYSFNRYKAWNRKSKPSGYRIDSIPINKAILIVCEGQTEKFYFEAFPVLGVKIKVVDLGGQSKLKLVESTQIIVDDLQTDFEIIWCVFDMDMKHGEVEYADFDNSIEKATALGYKVAYSNDVFELWFYLHYQYTDAQNLRGYYYDELSKFFGLNYVKEGKKMINCRSMYQRLELDKNASQDEAIKRARSLFNRQKFLPYHQQNPVTTVYELVEELNKNLRR